MGIKRFLQRLKPDSLDVLVNVELDGNNLAKKVIKLKSKKDINYALLDDSLEIPYVVNEEIKNLAKSITKNSKTYEEKARAIFDWMDNNIKYDKSEGIVKYRNSAEVLRDKAGVCGSESFLYIVLARLNGLNAQSVDVTKDYRNKKVSHGCAVVIFPNKKVFVDPAYHIYDVHHKQYRILKDAEMVNIFKNWR